MRWCPWEQGFARAVARENLGIVPARRECGHGYLSVAAVFHYSLPKMSGIRALGFQPGFLGLWSSAEALNSFQLLLLWTRRQSRSRALPFSTCSVPESPNQPPSCSRSMRELGRFSQMLGNGSEGFPRFLRPGNADELHLSTGSQTGITHHWKFRNAQHSERVPSFPEPGKASSLFN